MNDDAKKSAVNAKRSNPKNTMDNIRKQIANFIFMYSPIRIFVPCIFIIVLMMRSFIHWFILISLWASYCSRQKGVHDGSTVNIVCTGMIVKHFHNSKQSSSQNDNDIIHHPTEDSSRSSVHGSFSSSYHDKPLCTTIKKTVPGMQDGNFITRDPGHWRILSDGSRTYEPQTCSLQRFTAKEARECLAGHHLLMIGDSMMRFQFLSLAYFIEHGKWEHRFPMSENCIHKNYKGEPQCSLWNEPNILTEKDWAKVYGHSAEKSWKEMHSFIGGKGFNGRLDCQCLRHEDVGKSIESMFYQGGFSSMSRNDSKYSGSIPNSQPTKRPSIPSAMIDSFVNRRPSFQPRSNNSQHINNNKHTKTIEEGNQKRRQLSMSNDDVQTVKLSFLVSLNNSVVKLLSRSHCEETASCRYDDVKRAKLLKDVEDGRSWEVKDSLLDALDHSLSKVLPDVDMAVYNDGLWSLGYPDVNFVSQVMERLYNLTHSNSNGHRCFWKGTSPAFHVPALKKYPSAFGAADEPYRMAAMRVGCQVFDVAHVTKHFSVFNYQGGTKSRHENMDFEDEQKNIYADAAHFQPWVNEELNQIFLNILC